MTGPIVLAADPTLAMHPTTKQYVDAIFQGVNWKAAVRAATVAAGTLATSFANGQTVDGVVLATGDRILVKNQVSGPENGIYTVNAFGAPTRATDADTGAEIKDSTVAVGEGTANADSLWKMTNDGAITLGSTALVFVNISVASIPASYLDTDGTLAANSDTRVPSQKAVVSYAARKGTGSGRKLFTLYPENNQFFGTNYAALDLRNSHPISVFPDGVVAVYVGSGELPEDYVGGNGIIVDVDWMDDGVGTQKACFGVQIERMDVGTTDFDADSFASQVVDTTGVAASSTSGVQSKSSIAVPAANMDGAVAGDQIRVKITRETGQGNDTNTGSVQATRFKVREA
jgi:phage-related tail fiber protein